MQGRAWLFFALAALPACGTAEPPRAGAVDDGATSDAAPSSPAIGGDAAITVSGEVAIDAGPPSPPSVLLPQGGAGIAFDDLRFSPSLARVLVPAGRTGALDAIDPVTRAVAVIGGFSSAPTYDDAHRVGATSVDEGGGALFAIDRGASSLVVVDPARGAIVARAPTSSPPDYVRYVAATGEAWVTEPADGRVEIFRLSSAAPSSAAFVAVPGGPESLVIDAARGRAYTNTFGGSTIAIDVASRAVVATWSNGCASARGIALDEARGVLFVACAEGSIASLDVATGAILATVGAGRGIDVIDYAAPLRHLYVPASDDATLTFVGVPARDGLTVLGATATTRGAHCVVADGAGGAWVCDPARGRLLVFADPYPASTGDPPDASTDAPACVPRCAGRTCGPDGCGGACGGCAVGQQCEDGRCVVSTTCSTPCSATEKCAWDPFAKGGSGAYGCIPQAWSTDGCAGVGALGTCDQAGAMQRCTSGGLIQDSCANGCGLHSSASCGGLVSCVQCNSIPIYCAGVESAPICQEGLRIVCYDDVYTYQWCADTGTTCECGSFGCECL